MEVSALQKPQEAMNDAAARSGEHYYCYNAQQEVLDHVALTALNGVMYNIALVAHL